MTMLLAILAMSAPFGADIIVDTVALAKSRGVVIVDARPRDAYVEGHIPWAVHLNAADLSETRGGVQGLLKPVDELGRLVAEAGIQPGARIVLYSQMDTPDDLKTATRLFWILEYLGYTRVAVLDGGFARWVKEERPVRQGPPKPLPVPVTKTVPNRSVLATRSQVAATIESGSGVIVDNRSGAYFSGETKKDFIPRAGHIPSAVNLPATDLVEGPDNTLLKSDELNAKLNDQGITSETPVITYCNTGRAASVGYFAGRLAGIENMKLYDGSMSEWASRDDTEVETAQSGTETEGS